MPVFATPHEISAAIELSAGNVQVVASDRADTVVDVRPTSTADKSDAEAAAATRVDYADGRLTVRGPKARALGLSRKTRSVDVVVELPTGSRLQVDVAVGDCRSTGVLGECRVKNSLGHVDLDRTGPLRVQTAAGDVSVRTAAGDVDIDTGSGQVRVGAIGGAGVIKNANGNTTVGQVDGALRVRSANGQISVDRAGSDVEARSANGDIRVGAVVRGSVALNSGYGGLEIGVGEGAAAWLDLTTGFGRVVNSLDAGEAPESAATVEVRAQTGHGDITIRRA